jgi:hypothetical protein
VEIDVEDCRRIYGKAWGNKCENHVKRFAQGFSPSGLPQRSRIFPLGATRRKRRTGFLFHRLRLLHSLSFSVFSIA